MKKTDVTVAGEKVAAVKMKKGEVLQLNNVLSGLKVGKVSKEGAFALLDTKIELTSHVKKIEEAQKLAAEDLKPAGLKEGEKNAALEKEWNDKFVEFMNRYLGEEITVKFSRLTREDLYELTRENNLEISKAEILNVLV